MRVSLLQTYASRKGNPREVRQAGFVYSHGILISVTPRATYSERVQTGSELRPIEEAFDPREPDYPKTVKTGRVRGHTAWVKELSPDLSCQDQTVNRINPEPSASASVPASDEASQYITYDLSAIAHLTWMEGNAIIHLAGPLSIETLTALANAAEFQ